jgi:hypothetical protein
VNQYKGGTSYQSGDVYYNFANHGSCKFGDRCRHSHGQAHGQAQKELNRSYAATSTANSATTASNE